MTATLYPVAETAEAALREPRGFAARESEAAAMAARRVVFAVEPTGPAFPSREAAQAAYAGVGRGGGLAEGWSRLTPMADATSSTHAPVRPAYAEGRRWPAPGAAAPAQWRLWVSYWRPASDAADAGPPDAWPDGARPDGAARRLRRSAEGRGLEGQALAALARQPLRPVKPQQPLEIGLFEARRPEAPDLIIPDE